MRVAFLLGLAVASYGCGESQCQRFCEKVRGDLIKDFGVSPDQINCADKQWDTDCQQCFFILQAELDHSETLMNF